MKTFYIHNMGCKSNQFEGEVISENLRSNGMKQVKNLKDADLYILNSCSVTHKSDNEAFYLLRAAKHKNPKVKNVLTGCIAQIEKENLLKKEFIDYIIGNDEKLNLFENLNKKICVSDILEQTNFTEIGLADTSKTRASIKIQDGCDNRCNYCIIWKARGKSRSASLEFIINQINKLSKSGFKEIILTGIHVGQWGKDIGMTILDLLKEIEINTTVERYRIGSLYPTEINNELLDFLKRSKKFCPHFHLSLQSACDKTLKSMNRFYTVEQYMTQIDKINNTFDLPFIGSDIITGFAGESETDFETSKKNLELSGLTQIHTFPYSIRKGTIGENMPNQVPEREKERRATIVKKISNMKYKNFIMQNINTIKEVLIEKHRDKKSGNLKGITRNYITVEIMSDLENIYNTLQFVKIIKYENGIIYGEFIKKAG